MLNYVEDTIWLRATAKKGCDTTNKFQRYWFVCSFYGTDEQPVQPEIDITPNPNSGTMSILFGEMEGRVEVSVYDMQGQTIDHFSLEATPKSCHSYTSRNEKSGIYLFVFNYRGNIITRRIVLTN